MLSNYDQDSKSGKASRKIIKNGLVKSRMHVKIEHAKVQNSNDDDSNKEGGSHVCVRRVQNFRLTSSKCMVLVEQWKKLSHSNLVSLRQVFTSKAFGDQSMFFIYDFFAGAETLMAKHFTQTPNFFDQYG